jgi:hypothetical protein
MHNNIKKLISKEGEIFFKLIIDKNDVNSKLKNLPNTLKELEFYRNDKGFKFKNSSKNLKEITINNKNQKLPNKLIIIYMKMKYIN